MDKYIKFSDNCNNIVDQLNKDLLLKGTLSTDPSILRYLSYDCFNITKGEPTIDSICRFTITGLQHIFPLIKIDLYNNTEILIESNLINFSAIPNKNHIEYIEEIMIDIFSSYQHNEIKIPKTMYNWYFKTN